MSIERTNEPEGTPTPDTHWPTASLFSTPSGCCTVVGRAKVSVVNLSILADVADMSVTVSVFTLATRVVNASFT